MLGGTFDPIHVAHLAIAEAARDELGLERVLFVPARPAAAQAGPGRDRRPPTGCHGRAGDRRQPGVRGQHLEIDREGPSLHGRHRSKRCAASGWRPGPADLALILSVEALPGCAALARAASGCSSSAQLVVVPREGYSGRCRPRRRGALPGTRGARSCCLDGPRLGLSARIRRASPLAGRCATSSRSGRGYIGDQGCTRTPRRTHRS